MTTYDVAVVGLGPVGSTAAILFADAGLNVVAFERDEEVYRLPRAVILDGEIIRAFQPAGLAHDVAALLRPDTGERSGFANSKREWLFGTKARPFGGNGWPVASTFHQPEFEAFLRQTALAHPNVTAHIGCEVGSFHDLGETVTISATRPSDGAAITETASFMVACDGASSSTRRTLDIGWHNLGYDHDWLVVDVTVLPGHTLPPDTLQVCDPDRLATFVVLKEPHRRWEFKLNPGETRDGMLHDHTIRTLLEPWTPPDTVEVVRSAVYQFHAAVAGRWRAGRVLLAGDAAHQTPPFLGQGMNAGMRDVINLAWKLPLIISGTTSLDLLDSYQAERTAHATDLVEWAVALGQLMEHLAATEAAERDGNPPPQEQAGQRSSGYGQGRAAPPLRDGVVMLDQVTDTGSTGYLFRQPMVADETGNTFRLDDRLGAGFAIVGRTADDLVVNEHSRQIVEQLDIATVTIDDLTVEQGHLDVLFENAAAVVVRPDRYVFGHTTDTLTLDELLVELEAKTHLTGERSVVS